MSSGLTFNFIDTEAQRVCHKNLEEGIEESSMIFRDIDGSLTNKPNHNLVAADSFLHPDLNCENNDVWNMAVCDGHFARVKNTNILQYLFVKKGNISSKKRPLLYLLL